VVRLLRRPATWVAAVAAAVLLAAGGLAWSPWSDEPAPPALTAVQQVQQASDVRTVSSTEGGLSARVSWSAELGRSAITVDGLPPAPDGRTYQLWYLGRDEVVRSAGLFSTTGDGRGEAVLVGDANTAAAVAISLEPAGGSPAPTTTPLTILSLA
jgi:anti-sigma-K factor RskA